MTKTFIEKHWTELTTDELANAHTLYHQALVRFFKAVGENPFTAENHRRLSLISSRSAMLCRQKVARAGRTKVARRA